MAGVFSARVTGVKVNVIRQSARKIVQTYINALNEIVKDPDFTSVQGMGSSVPTNSQLERRLIALSRQPVPSTTTRVPG